MSNVRIKLIIYFEDPFWVGIIERYYGGIMDVCKMTFGAEPKDYEVNHFLQSTYSSMHFSPPVEEEKEVKEHINPKRLQREAKKQIMQTGIGTKSQQALKLLQEQKKVERKQYSRKKREAEQELQFLIKQEKRKQKHKGR